MAASGTAWIFIVLALILCSLLVRFTIRPGRGAQFHSQSVLLEHLVKKEYVNILAETSKALRKPSSPLHNNAFHTHQSADKNG